jgi:hypothetical protein
MKKHVRQEWMDRHKYEVRVYLGDKFGVHSHRL